MTSFLYLFLYNNNNIWLVTLIRVNPDPLPSPALPYIMKFSSLPFHIRYNIYHFHTVCFIEHLRLKF